MNLKGNIQKPSTKIKADTDYVDKKNKGTQILKVIDQLNMFEKQLANQEAVHDTRKKEIVFAISLKSKKWSRNWDTVQENLSKTLRSIFNNTDQNYRIIIAGHKKPNIKELNHKKVTWLGVKFALPKSPRGFFWDKTRKRRVIGAYLRKIGYTGYFMPVDADDWIHYRFVEYIRSQPISDAFIFNNGFMVNLAKKEVWMRNRFYGGCGTSQIFYFKNDEFPISSRKKDAFKVNFKVTIRHHGRVQKHLSKIKKNYKMVNFPLITWVLAHGDNNSMILRKKDNGISAMMYDSQGEEIQDWYFNFFKIN